jgi:7,8-dihydropterin-6-yl-methyl-4-(beta-D-ribofuranosyl)aminobenzene 5'-phosphate synthase
MTVVVENTAAGEGLLAEHGLACWIDWGGQYVLFDTGQGLVLRHNAQRMKLPVERVAAVVVSHGHYDHTGGLADVLDVATSATVFAHPASREPKYARLQHGASRAIGMPASATQAMLRPSTAWCQTSEPTSIVAGLTATGPIPRVTDYEDTGGPFFCDSACRHPDPLTDDQALFLQTEQGTIVLLGCAHAGVINTLRYVRQLTDGRPIHTVMGGMHLVRASQERLSRTIDELRDLGIRRFGPAHCTGSQAVAALWHAFPGQCFDFHVGTRLEYTARHGVI